MHKEFSHPAVVALNADQYESKSMPGHPGMLIITVPNIETIHRLHSIRLDMCKWYHSIAATTTLFVWYIHSRISPYLLLLAFVCLWLPLTIFKWIAFHYMEQLSVNRACFSISVHWTTDCYICLIYREYKMLSFISTGNAFTV